MAPRKKESSAYTFPHPMENEYLVGHSDTLNNFINAWNNRDIHPLHPVWMLTGPKGIGKATLAYKIAKMVNVSSLPEQLLPLYPWNSYVISFQ
jgi:DNA polymerase-3 subunit delta'